MKSRDKNVRLQSTRLFSCNKIRASFVIRTGINSMLSIWSYVKLTLLCLDADRESSWTVWQTWCHSSAVRRLAVGHGRLATKYCTISAAPNANVGYLACLDRRPTWQIIITHPNLYSTRLLECYSWRHRVVIARIVPTHSFNHVIGSSYRNWYSRCYSSNYLAFRQC